MTQDEKDKSVAAWDDFAVRCAKKKKFSVTPPLPVVAVDVTIEPAEAQKRTRKKKEITFPKGKFTIPELAKETGLSTTCIYLRLQDMKAAGQAHIVGEKRVEGQRGKPTPYYKVKQ